MPLALAVTEIWGNATRILLLQPDQASRYRGNLDECSGLLNLLVFQPSEELPSAYLRQPPIGIGKDILQTGFPASRLR
jgi:hypothetical protein